MSYRRRAKAKINVKRRDETMTTEPESHLFEKPSTG